MLYEKISEYLICSQAEDTWKVQQFGLELGLPFY